MAYTPHSLTCNGKLSAKNRDPDVSNIWTYKTADAMATVRALNYFTDALHRGMKAGDMVLVMTMTAGAPSAVNWATVMAVIAAGADLADGTTVSVTNT
jgi:hypothetical protein